MVSVQYRQEGLSYLTRKRSKELTLQANYLHFIIYETMKKILLPILALAFLLVGVNKVSAATPAWDVSGNYVVRFVLGGNFDHDVTLNQDAAGNITGNGGFPASGLHTYTWVIDSGTVSGSNINFTAHYTALPDAVTPLDVMHVTGVIAADGTMNGTWDDNYQGGFRTGTWSTISGAAKPVFNSVALTNIDQCKNDGWKQFGTVFKNQGQCVSFVANGKASLVQVGIYHVSGGSSDNVLNAQPYQGSVALITDKTDGSLRVIGSISGLDANKLYFVWVRDLTGYTGPSLFDPHVLGYFKLVSFTSDSSGKGVFSYKINGADLPSGTYNIQVAINDETGASNQIGVTVAATAKFTTVIVGQ